MDVHLNNLKPAKSQKSNSKSVLSSSPRKQKAKTFNDSHQKSKRLIFQSLISANPNHRQSGQHNPLYGNRASKGLKKKLVEFLIHAAESQRKMQIVKEVLCEEEDFTPATLFHRIDQTRKGYLIQADIQNYIRDNNMTFKGSELKILFGKMNVDKADKGVVMWEFQNFILPNQNARLRYMTMRRPVYIPLQNERLSMKIQGILSKLFTEIMKEQVKLRQLNASLISTYDFNAVHVFDCMANYQGFITGQSLQNFMQDQNQKLQVQEVGCLIRLIDRKGDGRIDLDDFKVFLATLGLKKVHAIFDELSPVPALKNFALQVGEKQKNRDSTLKQRADNNNKSSGLSSVLVQMFSPQKNINPSRSPEKKSKKFTSSKRSQANSSHKKN